MTFRNRTIVLRVVLLIPYPAIVLLMAWLDADPPLGLENAPSPEEALALMRGIPLYLATLWATAAVGCVLAWRARWPKGGA